MTGYVQVSTATETREQAVDLAKSLVTAKLAAGAQIVGPVTSVFWHLGEFGAGQEWQLLLKARADRYPQIEAHLVEHHPWTNPEVVATAIVAGSPDYLRWIGTTTEPDPA
ncbi:MULTISPECIES: divalent-cation tolerance protein CutA [Nocardiopsidaceae]|uniref:Divalent-cation tolerance protein CutA n=2 Tax=Nocardiopsidaceae TaxID=83676 RepID=A0ABY6YHG7_9ACTN|nr:divalent-cation tolerance protein CutA [Streptomonospora nanhaiensis]WAE71659.1 divalent-cation tolerance protein CutA [Streptomonospora nanhaiensis]